LARRKKIEVDFEKVVDAFIGRNFKDGKPMVTQPRFGHTYRFSGEDYVFTEEILQAMLATGRVKVISQTDKFVNLIGVVD